MPEIRWGGIGGFPRVLGVPSGPLFASPARPVPPLPPPLLEARLIGRIAAADVTWKAVHPLVRPGLFITGEAGASLDPASGSGIADALWMGNLAGEAVAHCLRSPAKATLAAALYHDRVMLHFKRRVQGLRQLYQSNGFTGFAQRAV